MDEINEPIDWRIYGPPFLEYAIVMPRKLPSVWWKFRNYIENYNDFVCLVLVIIYVDEIIYLFI